MAGGAQGQDAPEVTAHESPPPFQIRVETNLVMVPVVVRDAKGRPVGGLRKTDFRLLDNGKPREISGFTVETSLSRDAQVAAGRLTQSSGDGATALPPRFVTLFFDDLHLNDGALGQTRNAAWRYVSEALRPEDRVGVVTSSGHTNIEFTGDRARLHDVLFKVTGHSRTLPPGQCPAIGDYQAYLIDQQQQSDAIEIAVAEGFECRCRFLGDPAPCRDTERRGAVAQAAQIWALADDQSLRALELAEAVVRRMAALPGQRILVLVSPGFLCMTRAKMIDALIDRALRRNVMVSAIDAAGLYTRKSNNPNVTVALNLQVIKTGMERQGLNIQRDVLAGLAAGTGGTFFHNSNDLYAAFRETAQASEIVYLLSFSPSDVKMDGSFHTLRIALNTSSNFDLQARRGYVATRAPEGSPPPASEVQSLIYSQQEQHDFLATVTAHMDASVLRVTIHVDIQPLRFRKEAGRNLNTLTFDTALFDGDGKCVAGKESSLELRLPDAKLEKMRQSGINAETRFKVPPGTYRIREVVRDAETKKTTAVNGNVRVE